MKNRGLKLIVCLLITTPVLAGPYLQFSTGSLDAVSWSVSKQNGEYIMSFSNTEIDVTSTNSDSALNDLVYLPDMTLANVTKDSYGFITADMVPVGDGLMTIEADQAGPSSVSAGDTVLTGQVGTGGMLTLGKNWMAYSIEKDDIDVVSHVDGYSPILDDFAASENQGLGIDLSFTGESASSLFVMLDQGLTGPTIGTMSGQISVIPAPSAIILGAIGMSLVGWLRRR